MRSIPVMRRGFVLVQMLGISLAVLVFLRVSVTYAHKRGFWGFLESVGIGNEPTDWAARRENVLIRDMLPQIHENSFEYSMKFLQFVSSIMRSFKLTCMAGVDFIIMLMVQSRRTERTLTGTNWGNMAQEEYSISEQYAR